MYYNTCKLTIHYIKKIQEARRNLLEYLQSIITLHIMETRRYLSVRHRIWFGKSSCPFHPLLESIDAVLGALGQVLNGLWVFPD